MSRLAGQRVVVTRAEHQAAELARPLRAAGAEVVLVPMIGIAPPADPEPLRRAATQIDQYDWIIFSSVNAVTALTSQLRPAAPPPRGRIAVVGTATRDAIVRLGWHVHVVPEEFVAESLVRALPASVLKDSRVLLPSAAVTREVIPRALQDLGAVVDVVEAYRNVIPEHSADQARRIFSSRPLPEWITFTSPSTVDNFVAAVGADPISDTRVASIGPVTSAAIKRHGLRVHAEPEEHTIAGMVQAMEMA
jgi:uroporphyrinogen III methyltransferase/synthase